MAAGNMQCLAAHFFAIDAVRFTHRILLAVQLGGPQGEQSE
jgi:hypothetical protein